MDIGIDRKIVLKQQTETSLYRWSLSEVDEDGNEVEHGLIPWGSTLWFRIEKLSIYDTSETGAAECQTMAQSHEKRIFAQLAPFSIPEGISQSPPVYSLFGTDRKILEFNLSINVLEDANELGYCTAYACVADEYEIDFRTRRVPDAISFELFVPESVFREYVQIVSSGLLEKATFSASRVKGFYSHWSPSISADFIKVLGVEDQQPIEAESGCAVIPHRTKEIGETTLNFIMTQTPAAHKKNKSEAPPPVQATLESPVSPISMDQTNRLLKSIRSVGICIVVLLVAILFRQ